MKTKFVNIISLMFFLTSLTSVSYAAENAFGSLPSANVSPQSSGGYSSEQIDLSVHPLLQNEIISNTIIGIMISPSLKSAYIRTANGDDYFVRVGDKLGNANGTITEITYEGIEVTEDSKVVSLAVRNRSVSNENSE